MLSITWVAGSVARIGRCYVRTIQVRVVLARKWRKRSLVAWTIPRFWTVVCSRVPRIRWIVDVRIKFPSATLSVWGVGFIAGVTAIVRLRRIGFLGIALGVKNTAGARNFLIGDDSRHFAFVFEKIWFF